MARTFLDRIAKREAVVGIIGLGYVGIPLAITALKSGYKVIGFDVDAERVAKLNAGKTAIKHIPMDAIIAGTKDGKFEATSDFSRLDEPDALLIAVPTPLNKYREPDLSYIVKTTDAISKRLRKGQLVVLESTTYPGTTDEVMRPILEKATGLTSGKDFFLAFSPEREDPGNPDFGTSTIPKVVGGDGKDALDIANALYATLVVKTVPVSSTATAEAVKLTENIFRAINIALVNELKVVYGAMGVDIWEVIEAAKTKPFGFMPFYPGPGLGGHCIPIDPFYLTWKAREYDLSTRFIELAGQINTRMPYLVVNKLGDALGAHSRKSLVGSTVLVLGIAYKKNIDDMRESPALKLIELVEAKGAATVYHDPYIPVIPPTREHANLTGRVSVPLDAKTLKSVDAILIATDHDDVDYELIVNSGKLVIDTRNACARLKRKADNVIKA
ncbi:MAG: nucleotide sugar dehydrogenase [Proteobacteria bacterium]|nr:nucleotide sugar dehydrogenase [Pseudomonadota bacterium]